jgi:hypothetical protein
MASKIPFLFVFVFIASLSFSQSIPWTEDFESGSGGYVSSISECTDNSFDYFTVTDGSDIAGVYNGSTGNYFAAMDIDAATCPGGVAGAVQTLTWSGIDISGCTTLNFSVDVAEDDDGSNQDWDAGDYVHIDYRVDGGAWLPLIWFEAFDLTGAETNSYPALDNDFNTIGEGIEVTETFQTFSNVIGSFGNSIDLQITIRLDAGDEDFALDNLQLTGSCNTYSCIWSENFSTQADGTQNDPGGRWTTTAGNCDADGAPGTVDDNYWGTDGGEFRVNDIEGLTCCGGPGGGGGNNDNIFITENIDISSYTQISISITLRAYDD